MAAVSPNQSSELHADEHPSELAGNEASIVAAAIADLGLGADGSSACSHPAGEAGAQPPGGRKKERRATYQAETPPHINLGRRLSVPVKPTTDTLNPMPHSVPSYGMDNCPNPVLFDVKPASTDRLVVVMAGLPARGKTHIARRVKNYLTFFHGVACENVNLATYGKKSPDVDASDLNDQLGSLEEKGPLAEAREEAISEVKRFLAESEGDAFSKVVFFDGTNATVDRRAWILQRLKGLGCKVLFIECVCNNRALLEENIRAVHTCTPEYDGMTFEETVGDVRRRCEAFKKIYQPINCDGRESHLPWIRVIDCEQYIINNVHGYLQGRITQLVMSLTNAPHRIYLSRHGQSAYNELGKIGGDSGITDEGKEYAKKLAEYAEKVIARSKTDGSVLPARLWTSGLRRTQETAQFISHPTIVYELPEPLGKSEWVQMHPRAWRNLDEIYAGVCDGMTYEEIQEVFPEEFELRKRDKLGYRYPRGESYLDVLHRLEPVVMEMERCKEPLLVIAHQGILRLIYAYFMGLSREEAPFVSIPLNTVIELTPGTYSCLEKRDLLHTKMSINSDGQMEPELNLPTGLKPKASRLSKAEDMSQLTFQTYRVESPMRGLELRRQMSERSMSASASEEASSQHQRRRRTDDGQLEGPESSTPPQLGSATPPRPMLRKERRSSTEPLDVTHLQPELFVEPWDDDPPSH